MITNCNDPVTQQRSVKALVEKARAVHDDRRQDQRYPFFQPVTITAEHSRPVALSAFSRDISESGIGLLLYWPLKPGSANLVIHFDRDEPVSVTGYVTWCRPCGQGWYTAGISFDERYDVTA
jgi:hypothetical protein